MQFELTDAIINDILFFMENQDGEFCFDAFLGEVVAQDALDEFDVVDSLEDGDESAYDYEEDPEQRLYRLPEWSSVDGFRLMERFAGNVRNPIAQKELLAVLSSGKGVFRGFKNVLLQYPEIEKKWFAFKDAQMKIVVKDWYNNLRVSWELAPLDEDFSESDTDSVLGDFNLRLSEARDFDVLNCFVEKTKVSFTENFDDERIAFVCGEMWKQNFSAIDNSSSLCLIAETPAEEIVGVIQLNVVSKNCKDSFVIEMLYVESSYRGLGIAPALIQKACDVAASNGVKRLLTANIILPESFVKVIEKVGFVKLGSGFLLELL